VDDPPWVQLGAGPDDTEVVERIAAALAAGGAVVLPTDTVYGLAALPRDHAATDRLFELKGRPDRMPLAVLCAEVGQVLELVDPSATALVTEAARRWWPGPLTLVLPRRIGVHLYLGEPTTTIGVRIPDHDVVRAVAATVGPVAATSANRHGEPTPSTARAAAAALGRGVALVVDGGTLEATASTVVDATTRPWSVLREGPILGADVVGLADAPEAADQ
jgi:L-threonylcarbamoyladenylate synthase